MYTVIEEIEVNPSQNMASHINSQSSRPDYSQSFRKKYYEDPSEIYPSQPGSIKMWSQNPEDMYYNEPMRQRMRLQDPSMHEFQNYQTKALNRTSIKSLMDKPQDIQPQMNSMNQMAPQQPQSIEQPSVPVLTTTPPVEAVTMEDMQKMIDEVKDMIKTNTDYFKDKEKRMRNRLRMIENLLKGIMIFILVLLFVLLLRR